MKKFEFIDEADLTVRDHIAIRAMQGYVVTINDPKVVAKAAYELADAMVEESVKF